VFKLALFAMGGTDKTSWIKNVAKITDDATGTTAET
jgi:hypothetical protein